jgi:hypothetical protein
MRMRFSIIELQINEEVFSATFKRLRHYANNLSSDTTVQSEAAEQSNVGRVFNLDDIVAHPAL